MKRLLFTIVCTGFFTFGSVAFAQEIVRDYALSAVVGQGDRQIAAFPSVRDPNVYYYLPTRATIPIDRGVPRISFVRFNQKDAVATDEGGIISAYFQLGISENERSRLEDAVQSVNSNAVLRGPVIFEDGTYRLLTAVANDAPLIVGEGSAATHEGDRMYVTAMLTQEGANRLFTTFQTATPSFTVELGMTYKAYRAPIEAILEADFESIYKSKSFEAAVKAGVSNPKAGIMIGADIKTEFDKLRRDGAIKITYIGEDQSQTDAIDAAYEIILNQMFEEVEPSTITPQMSDDLNDRASRSYATAVQDREKARKRADAQRTQQCRASRTSATPSPASGAEPSSSASSSDGDESNSTSTSENGAGSNSTTSSNNQTEAEADKRARLNRLVNIYQKLIPQYEEQLTVYNTRVQYSGSSFPESHPPESRIREIQGKNTELYASIDSRLTGPSAPSDDQERALMQDFKALLSLVIAADTRELEIIGGGYSTNMSNAIAAYQNIIDHINQALPKAQSALNAAESELESIGAEPADQSNTNTESAENLSTPPPSITSTDSSSSGATVDTESGQNSSAAPSSIPPTNSSASEACQPEGDDGSTAVAISAEIRYRIKTSIKQLKFVLNMKRSVSENFKASFAADVPDLTRYLNDERVFAKRALDRLAFGQRDIIVDTSELATADFDSVVSTAGVYIRKEPEVSGRQIKTDDIVVTRARIDEDPESFRLTYMADGDNDAQLFNQYQYKVDWTLKGGIEIEGEWQDRESAQIPLAPPVKLRTVRISLDPDFVERENIAAATVRLYSTYGGATEVQEVQIEPSDQDGSYSTTATVITPRDSFEYEIEKIFTRRGQPSARTPKASTSDTYLILSDLN